MEPKQVFLNKSPPPSARYKMLIAHDNQPEISELWGRHIRGCFHGWVILSNDPDSVLWSLWNPPTSKLIRLPPLIHKQGDSHAACLSSPPGDHRSVFLLFTEDISTIVFCRLDCKRKKLKWTEMSYAKQLRSISGVDCALECPTCCNGNVYAMTMDLNYMFVIHIDIEVKDEEVVISLVPFVKLPHNSRISVHSIYSFLKGSCTDLFYIEVYFKDDDETRIREVYLFKLDMTSMMWEGIEDLKSAVFFLQFGNLVFYRSPVASDMGGYVYILDDMDKIISFHVKDRTMSLFSMSCIARESHMLAWAMLECRSEVDHPESIEEEEEEEEDKDYERVMVPVNAEFDRTTGESHLLSIPINILVMIMERCVGVEYMRFRATCKLCRSAAPKIQWSSKIALKRLEAYSLVSPWLMVLDNYRGIMTFIDPICGDSYFIKAPRELDDDAYRVYCSRYGWLLMYKLNGPVVLVNPFTRETRKCPEVPFVESFCFSAPPTSPDCMVVGFSRRHWHVYILCLSQETSWRRYRLNFGSSLPYSFHFPTFVGRYIYALCNNGKIVTFKDMGSQEYSWWVAEEKAPRICCGSSTEYYLSKCDERLLLVIADDLGEFVEVFKLNDSTKKWEKIDSLGKHMLFISDATCICLEAKIPEMENKIYFPRLSHDGDTKMVFYSLETRKYHTFDERNIQESFGDELSKTKLYCYSHTWIEPSWSW